MLAVLKSCTLTGWEGMLTLVEVDVSRGFPHFDIVGLADTAVKESRERVRAALANNGFKLPADRITVNLAPAAIQKHGPVLTCPLPWESWRPAGRFRDRPPLGHLGYRRARWRKIRPVKECFPWPLPPGTTLPAWWCPGKRRRSGAIRPRHPRPNAYGPGSLVWGSGGDATSPNPWALLSAPIRLGPGRGAACGQTGFGGCGVGGLC